MNICSRDRELLCINFKFLIFMVIPVLLVVASLVVLYFGADFLVKGSSSLAVRFGILPNFFGSFFYFFFLLISQALYAKGKECIKEKQRPFSLRIGLQR